MIARGMYESSNVSKIPYGIDLQFLKVSVTWSLTRVHPPYTISRTEFDRHGFGLMAKTQFVNRSSKMNFRGT